MQIFEEYGIEFLMRYAHIISGITWIGLLYYFNFVQTPAFAAFEAGPRNEAFTKLVPRALWWFRWGAASTLAFGLLLFILGMSGDLSPFEEMKTVNTLTILGGMAFGITMFLNVWLIIWPNQQIVMANAEGLLAGREADPAAAAAARKGACASRTNTLLSIPMLFFMVATGHFVGGYDAVPDGGSRAVWYIVILAVIAVVETIALRAPAVGKPEAWYIDQHKNTIIAGFVLLAVLYLIMEILFG
jgi:uncharacterized membrane protein